MASEQHYDQLLDKWSKSHKKQNWRGKKKVLEVYRPFLFCYFSQNARGSIGTNSRHKIQWVHEEFTLLFLVIRKLTFDAVNSCINLILVCHVLLEKKCRQFQYKTARLQNWNILKVGLHGSTVVTNSASQCYFSEAFDTDVPSVTLFLNPVFIKQT